MPLIRPLRLSNRYQNRPTLLSLLAFCLIWLPGPYVLSAREESSDGKHFLWQVDSPTTRIYLMGSIHLLRQDVYPLAPVIEEAFATSDVLVLEADPFAAPPEELQETIMAYATYPDGQTLQSQLSEQEYVELQGILLEVGIPSQSVQHYQPWCVATMVDQALSSRLGIRPEYGVDYYFRSKVGQKEVQELESVEAQLRLLASFSDQEQLLMMWWAVEDLEQAVEEFEEFLTVWQRGDIQAMEAELEQEFQEEPRFRPIWNAFIEKRNLAMVDRIVAFLKTQKRHFIVVGAGHLIGPKGLIALLRQRGYAVQQL